MRLPHGASRTERKNRCLFLPRTPHQALPRAEIRSTRKESRVKEFLSENRSKLRRFRRSFPRTEPIRFGACPAENGGFCSPCRPAPPAKSLGSRGPRPSAGSRRGDHENAGTPFSLFFDPLGASRFRQNHDCAPACRCFGTSFCANFRGIFECGRTQALF